MAVSVPDLNDKESLRKAFSIGQKQFNEALKFLIETGLVADQNGRFSVGMTRVRLGNDSAWIVKHHTNWRLRAVENLEKETNEDLHYSGIFSISVDDAKNIKDIMLNNLKEKLKVVDSSKEEKVFVMNLDFFSLLK